MTIQELADRAGVTTRTIRYYVEQGVLPPPGHGRPAEYTHEHIRLLDLVRRLKEQYLPLEEIRDMLQRLSAEQVEAFLGGSGSQREEQQSGSSAADYITQVLNRGTLRTQLKEQAVPPPTPPASAAPSKSGPGTPIVSSRPSGVIRSREDSSAVTPIAAMPAESSGHGEASNQNVSEERTWQRVTLAPGMELHYEATITLAQRSAIARIIEAARTVLGSDPGKGTEEQK
ncbi:MAG TPA: MerR family transcriptional regulator [Chloroflexia bacterium]|jgi:DNA-binding transcriptional MerR regulator